MESRRILQCLTTILLHLLIVSGPKGARAQGDIPVVNPTTPGGDTTTPTIINPPGGDTTTPTIINPPGGTTTTPTINPPGGTTTTPTINPPLPPAVPQTGPTTNPTGSTSGGQWCIASPAASPTALQVAIDYACGYGGADCSAIQPGSSCYEPNTLRNHASYAFNDYYQKHPGPMSCSFGGTAQLTNKDPSSGNCHYTQSSTSTSISPPSPPSPTAYMPPTIPTPPTNPFTTPTTTMPGGGPTVYGVAEPTGQPSSAMPLSHSFVLVIAAVGILMPLLGGNYL